MIDTILSVEFFARIVGSFEMNEIATASKSPLQVWMVIYYLLYFLFNDTNLHCLTKLLFFNYNRKQSKKETSKQANKQTNKHINKQGLCGVLFEEERVDMCERTQAYDDHGVYTFKLK